jgi:hypothetical protein
MALAIEQRTSPIWSFRVLASLHFFRLLYILFATVIILISFTYEPQVPIYLGSTMFLLFIPPIFIELLCGFLFVSRRMSIAYVALLYLIVSIIPPFHSFLFVIQFVIITLSILLSLSFQVSIIPAMIFGSTIVIELILLTILGLNWINNEWVRDST